jgi:hypothetical protein
MLAFSFQLAPLVAQISVNISPTSTSGVFIGTLTLVCSNYGSSPNIAGVQYLLNGKPISTVITSAPYEFTWNSANVWDGFVTIQASVRDAQGNEIARSSVQTIRISNKGATAQYLNPVTNPVSGQVPWTISANSPSGIQAYTFLLDGVPVDALFDSHYQQTISLDTTNLINGPHELFTGVYSQIDENSGVAMAQTTINVQNPTAIAQLRARWSTMFMQPGTTDNVGLTAMTTEGLLTAAPPSVYTSSDPTVVAVDGTGKLTAGRPGVATILAQAGNLSGTTRVIVSSSSALVHFGKDGSLLTDYDPARSLFLRTLFQLNFDDIAATPALASQLHSAAVNTITTGLYDNPADAGSPDYATWYDGWNGYWSNVVSSAQTLGFSLLLTGDDLAREPYELLNSITNSWSADAIRTALASARDSGRVIGIEMVDEVNALWGDTPHPTDGRWQNLGVPDSAFGTLMQIMNGVPGRPMITWPVISGSDPNAVANWMGDPAWADYTSDYWALMDWPAYPTGASLNDFQRPMDGAIYGRIPWIQSGRPTLTLGSISGPFYTKRVSGLQYVPGMDALQMPPVPMAAVAAQIMYAAEAGAAGVRMYAYDSQDLKYQRSSAPAGTIDLQTGSDPFTVGTDRWAAMSAAFNLIAQLEPYLLRTQIHALNLGPRFVAAARQGPTSTLFMATNFSEAVSAVTLDLSPYFVQPMRRATLYRLWGPNLLTTDITASAGNLSQAQVSFQPGETVVWVFSTI